MSRVWGIRFALLSVLLLLASVSCAGLDPARQAACTPDFPYTNGWLGGDAAYSIPLGGGESVWLFGDTFVGTPDQETRQGAAFIHNSIGISRCARNGTWQIDYAWSRAADDSARAFIDTGEEANYWWLFGGFEYADKLYIGLLGVEASEPRGPLNLPFRNTGMQLARVSNYREDPLSWNIEILPLSDSQSAFPGSAMVVHEEHVYLFAFLDQNAEHYPRMLARLPLAAFAGDDPKTAMEYLARNEQWRPGFEPGDAMILMEDNASEMSVHYHDELGVWLALYNYPNLTDQFPEVPPSDLVYIRIAERLEGPWSKPTSVFQIPELNEEYAPGRDPNTFCYAAKEHPQYARQGRLLITYVCNLFTPTGQDPWAVLSRLAVDMDLYRPRVISIPIPSLELD